MCKCEREREREIESECVRERVLALIRNLHFHVLVFRLSPRMKKKKSGETSLDKKTGFSLTLLIVPK